MKSKLFKFICKNADKVGLTKAMYFRMAVELLNQLSDKKGSKLLIQEKGDEKAYNVLLPSITCGPQEESK